MKQGNLEKLPTQDSNYARYRIEKKLHSNIFHTELNIIKHTN